MAAGAGLTAAAVIERDLNGDAVWSWVYPAIDTELRGVIKEKAGLDAGLDAPRRIFGRSGKTWFYVLSCPIDAIPDAEVAYVEAMAVVICADKFHPEQYFNLAGVLTQQYAQGGSGPRLLAAFLAVSTTGSFEQYSIESYQDVRRAYLKGSLKSVVQKFAVESILIYIAVLLKKRVCVIIPDPEELLSVVRAIPQFVFKRLNWDILQPYVGMSDAEIAALAASKEPYVAGFTDPEISDREDLYDVLVDGPNATVRVASHASGFFALGKIHKEIAMYMVATAQDETAKDMDLVKGIVEKTDTLVDGLNKLATPSEEDESQMLVTEQAIRSRKMQASMHTFLINLAKAEGMFSP